MPEPVVPATPDRTDTPPVVAPHRPDVVIALQRTAGNTAVQRMLTVSRFNEEEHKPLGDEATNGATVISEKRGNDRFDLTFGDVVMLSGDWFEPHELMSLARKPGNRGALKGTRDEIVYALKVGLKDLKPPDTRFRKGGIWADWTFSDPVTKAVDARFDSLASKNAAHYAAPSGRDATGEALPPKQGEASAGGTYRSLHEEALWLAYTAGTGIKVAGRSVDFPQAMAMEAAGAHFLTDAFAAGHVRTPISLMRDYWGSRYPLFWYNLRHKIALDTAAEINRQDDNDATLYGSVQAIYEDVLSEVDQQVGDVAISFGDLVAKVLHDWDNRHGVAVAGGGKVYGDSRLDDPDPQNVTRTRAVAAIRAGVKELRVAAGLGMAKAGLTQADVVTHVLATTADPSGQYAAEALIPRPDASNPAQNWKAATADALWTQPIVAGAAVTVGSEIEAGLKPNGPMYNKLEGLAAKFPAAKKVVKLKQDFGTVRPRLAFRNGFFLPLVADPHKGINAIIDWAPNYGLADKDRDDISLDTGNELMKGTKKGEKLAGMTTPARIGYVRELIGTSVADDEESLILEIFRTAHAAERPKIYQGVEGHPWRGDWINGVTVDDDEIWNALKRYRLAILRNLINEASSGRP